MVDSLVGAKIKIKGIVQGVGFRPFVYNLAKKYQLSGWVRNSSAGVEIEVEGLKQTLELFIHSLQNEIPPLANIDHISIDFCPANGYSSFEILDSIAIPDASQPISPDISICPDCLQELFDCSNRRYLYPFINCTNCGPRFTIIKDIPYDRPQTTMAQFDMCSDCEAEYLDPNNRRFHAQPIACPVCGPHIWLEGPGYSSNLQVKKSQSTLILVQQLLIEGNIVVIKGLGGFHLACDAMNSSSVDLLRSKKSRIDKPFALMMPDISTIEAHCILDEQDRQKLLSRERPIVILNRRADSCLADAIAPNQNTVGVMLPYTPLHCLLFHPLNHEGIVVTPPQALVMTSGNISEEPIVITNEEARKKLNQFSDCFLLHNRPINERCDDSVILSVHSLISDPVSQPVNDIRIPRFQMIRRARGYSPNPIKLPFNVRPVLAGGAEQKNAFCLAIDTHAYLSPHIGDLDNYETFASYESMVKHYEYIFRFKPQLMAYDLHPNYLSTQYIMDQSHEANVTAYGIQHHHAHIASCMAENGFQGTSSVIGVAFDGTGYGLDGTIWGGEFLIADYKDFHRFAHFRYVPLPGGDASIKKPALMALAALWASNIDWDDRILPAKYLLESERQILKYQLVNGINVPETSSVGRLFDIIASLSGIRQSINYDAQAAIELECVVDHSVSESYEFDYDPSITYLPGEIDICKVLLGVIRDMELGVPVSVVSARFHNTLIEIVVEVLVAMRNIFGINDVFLSGGVWQNRFLLSKTYTRLVNNKFSVFTHHYIPPNDGGIALGQAVIASCRSSS